MTAADRPSSAPTSHASTSAASQLPPAFPGRAPWGTAGKLRAWQAAALEQYLTTAPRDFLAVATPGAGKTTFALRIATELLQAGVAVTDDLQTLSEAPDVIHGHHTVETLTALLHFPAVPAVWVCHDATAWHDTPPLSPRILRYVAVDEAVRDRLRFRHGVPDERIRVVGNAVDLQRFRPRSPLPERPGPMHQAAAKKLRQASGDRFERAYMEQMVKDHVAALDLLERVTTEARDPDLRALAQDAIPLVRRHLDAARRIAGDVVGLRQ